MISKFLNRNKGKYLFLGVLFFFMATLHAAFAYPCSYDPFDDSCDPPACTNGADNPPDCNNCSGDSDMCGGNCVASCPSGYARDVNCGCSQTGCENDATNPPDCDNNFCMNGADNPPDCNSCPGGSDMCGGNCMVSCGTDQTRNNACGCDSTCSNGRSNPPACDQCNSDEMECDGACFPACNGIDESWDSLHCSCVTYCSDSTACNYGAEEACKTDCGSDYCCADPNALNVDGGCPDPSANPPKVENNSGTCTYCEKGSSDPACQVSFCNSEDPSNQGALNGETQAGCDAANPMMTCSPGGSCTYAPVNYCSSDDARNAGALNAETEAQCQARAGKAPCFATPSACQYPTEPYCNDQSANNYETEDECNARVNNSNVECTPDGPCSYDQLYCDYGFAADVTCPSGFHFTTPQNTLYWYSYELGAGDVCTDLTGSQYTYLQNYLKATICTADTPVCTEGYCSQIDWCPDTAGVQTDPAQCVDVCPDDPGVQTNESQCTINTDGSCGDLNNGSAHSTAEITGTDACTVGNKSTVSLSNGHFTWSCLGVGSGSNANCNATLSCNTGTYYCDAQQKCLSNGVTCNKPNDCVNPDLCVFNGAVSLTKKLAVTPIVNRGESCFVDLGSDSNVFESFDNTTHCRLYSQDGIITTLDPNSLTTGNTRFTQTNIQKDMTYTLKCFEGTETATSTYETSIGSCRLNLNLKEAN